jgi:hypothetical protein
VRVLLCFALWCFGLSSSTSKVEAQEPGTDGRIALGALLQEDSIDATLQGLDERFFGAVMLLIPELAREDQEVLASVVEEAFRPERVREDVVELMSGDVAPETLTLLSELRRTGPEAELRIVAARHAPERPFEEFVAGLGAPPRERLQLMAALAEARGEAGTPLLVDEALRAAAYRLVVALGGVPGAFVPLPDERFDAAYRQGTISRALELLHRLEPVPDDLVRRVIDGYSAPPVRAYVEALATSVQEAVMMAGERVVAATAPAAEGAPETGDPGLPCRSRTCGYVVEWRGSPPTGTNRRFGAAGELETRVLAHLVGGGLDLQRGPHPDGLTVRLMPRTMAALCDFMSGTDNSGCLAIDDVRVDFLGAYPDVGTPSGFLVRNRCGSQHVMGIDGISALVAMRVAHALGPEPRPDPPQIRC